MEEKFRCPKCEWEILEEIREVKIGGIEFDGYKCERCGEIIFLEKCKRELKKGKKSSILGIKRVLENGKRSRAIGKLR